MIIISEKRFNQFNLEDSFFDIFRSSYPEFDVWFKKKAEDYSNYANYSKVGDNLVGFMYLKLEDESEDYSHIFPSFEPKKRLKIGSLAVKILKVNSFAPSYGRGLGKAYISNAITHGEYQDEIYLTMFEKTEGQKKLCKLLLKKGFYRHGYTDLGEVVMVRDNSKYTTQSDRTGRVWLTLVFMFYLSLVVGAISAVVYFRMYFGV